MKLSILAIFTTLLVPAFGETNGNFLVRYASNLVSPTGPGIDTIINVSDTGATIGTTIPANLGTMTSITDTYGNLCANVYVLDARDEQLVACCSCFLTPDSAGSFSALTNLVANTLTGTIPNSIVIKIVASLPVTVATPVGGFGPPPGTPIMPGPGVTTCDPTTVGQTTSALGVGGTLIGQPLVPTGLIAWARSNRSETGFANAQLTTGELGRLTQLCTYNTANGSGTGVCKFCLSGAL